MNEASHERAAGPRRVLVTGAAGFVGLHVTRALIARGHAVTALTHRTALSAEVRAVCARVVSGDICDPRVRDEALAGAEAVCHAGAYIPANPDDLRETESCHRINALASLDLAREAGDRGVKRFVHLSAGNMYSHLERPCEETDAVFPSESATPYLASKLAADVYLASLARRGAIDVVSLRVATPYGPGEPTRKLIPTFLRLAEEGRPLRVTQGGAARFSFVHVADVADCAALAVERGEPGIYNVAAGEHTSILELARAVAQVCDDRAAKLEIEPAVGAGFRGFPSLSIRKMTQTWGLRPRTLLAGLRSYRDHLRKHGGSP